MTKEQLLRQYDALMLCVENGKYGETKETVRKLMEGALDELVEDVRAERDREIVKWIKKHSRFADPQIPKDESDKRWEIHYTGYREAVNDLITHLTK